ncbi:MAG: HopJ type III effector protein [Methylococcaceae bacterium]
MYHYLEQFISKVRAGIPVSFSDTLCVIHAYYEYHPVRFSNGLGEDCYINEAGMNEGSCRLFYFARLHNLNSAETLHLFGSYYYEDVLGHPDGQDHINIRTFIRYGWPGLFHNDGNPACLVLRAEPLTVTSESS